MSERAYIDTVGTLSRTSGYAEGTIRSYADLGLLDYVKLPNGMRLFRAGQAARVREIFTQRMASRGRRSA